MQIPMTPAMLITPVTCTTMTLLTAPNSQVQIIVPFNFLKLKLEQNHYRPHLSHLDMVHLIHVAIQLEYRVGPVVLVLWVRLM